MRRKPDFSAQIKELTDRLKRRQMAIAELERRIAAEKAKADRLLFEITTAKVAAGSLFGKPTGKNEGLRKAEQCIRRVVGRSHEGVPQSQLFQVLSEEMVGLKQVTFRSYLRRIAITGLIEKKCGRWFLRGDATREGENDE